MSSKDISISGKDGSFMGYLSVPRAGSGGGVVVIQEVFGVNAWVRQVADFFAAQGYFALAPDLFWRQKPGIQLDPTKPEEFQQGIDHMMKNDIGKSVEDIQATIAALRKTPGCTGNVGVTGFCMGGLLTYLAACNTDAQAFASYYGGGISQMLDQAKKIKAPIIFHLAANDGYIPPAAQGAIRDAFAGNKNAQVYIYDDTDHGFCRETDPRFYKPAAAKLAHERTLELFRNNVA